MFCMHCASNLPILIVARHNASMAEQRMSQSMLELTFNSEARFLNWFLVQQFKSCVFPGSLQ